MECRKATELSGVSPFCLWLDHFSRCRDIRIGSYYQRALCTDENPVQSIIKAVLCHRIQGATCSYRLSNQLLFSSSLTASRFLTISNMDCVAPPLALKEMPRQEVAPPPDKLPTHRVPVRNARGVHRSDPSAAFFPLCRQHFWDLITSCPHDHQPSLVQASDAQVLFFLGGEPFGLLGTCVRC
jgi:hypothetical protein